MRMMTSRAARCLWVVGLALSLAGCSVPAPQPAVSAGAASAGAASTGAAVGAPSGEAVPWKALPAQVSPSPAAPSAPACAAGALAAQSLTFGGFAAGTEGFGSTLALAPQAKACSLAAGSPARLLTAAGGTLATVDLQVLNPAPAVVVASDSRVGLTLDVSNWCTARTPHTILLSLAGGSALRLAVGRGPADRACSGPTTYEVRVTSSMTVADASTPAPGDPLALAPSLQVQGSPVPGQSFAYTVTLTNQTATTVAFTTCPSYVEGFKLDAATPSSYQLDCAAASPIPPGGSEVFAMSVAVPAAARLGQATLSWGIVGSVNDGNAEVLISAP